MGTKREVEQDDMEAGSRVICARLEEEPRNKPMRRRWGNKGGQEVDRVKEE